MSESIELYQNTQGELMVRFEEFGIGTRVEYLMSGQPADTSYLANNSYHMLINAEQA